LFLGNSTKSAATRAALFGSNMHQIFCRLGLCPRPTGELTALLQTPKLYLGGLLLNGEDGEDGRGGRKRGEHEGERRGREDEGKGKERGRGVRPLP